MSGLHQGDGGIVVDGFGVHRFDHADIIDDFREVRQGIADPGPTLAMLLKTELIGGSDGERLLAGSHAGQALIAANGIGKRFGIQLFEPWFIVEEFHLRRAAMHEEVDHAFGFAGKMGTRDGRRFTGEQIGVQQRTQGRGADAGRAGAEELAAGEIVL